MLADIAHLVISMLMGGVGLIFLWTDRGNAASRALACCFLAAGAATVLAPPQSVSGTSMVLAIGMQIFETLSMLFGVEWGRRIGQSAGRNTRPIKAAGVLFRVAQLILLIFGAMSIGYVLIFPEYAVIDPEGLVKVRAVEFAVFAPLLGTGLLLSGIALLLLMLSPLDPIERIRFNALLVAGPLFMLALMISERYEPLVMSLGLLVVLGGSVRYLIIQSQRGAAMQQFVSPELASRVKLEGMATTMRREKREISVVACDLRGFTAFARSHDSDTVVGLLERYYALAGQIAAEYGGTVKDHAGDGILILVGASGSRKQYALRALNLAQTLSNKIRPLLEASGFPLGLGVGVATGEATIGAIQGAGRLEYVAVGNVVNLASRLCDRAADGEILLDASSRSLAEVEASTEQRPAEPMKGYAEALPTFALAWSTLPAGRSPDKL